MEFRKYTFDDNDWTPKVQYMKGFPKKYFVWNQHLLDPVKKVYACEGIMDCLRIMDVGQDNVCATYGSAISKHQSTTLANYPHLVWVLDRDVAGFQAVEKLAASRGKDFEVAIPYGLDIGEGTDWQVQDTLKNRRVSVEELLDEIDRDWLLNPRNYEEDEQNIHWI
jgi:DNA primase